MSAKHRLIQLSGKPVPDKWKLTTVFNVAVYYFVPESASVKLLCTFPTAYKGPCLSGEVAVKKSAIKKALLFNPNVALLKDLHRQSLLVSFILPSLRAEDVEAQRSFLQYSLNKEIGNSWSSPSGTRSGDFTFTYVEKYVKNPKEVNVG